MRRFLPARVSSKLFLFSFFLLGLMLLLSFLGYRGVAAQKREMEELYAGRFQAFIKVSRLSESVVAANAHIYRVVNMINQEKEEAEIDREIASFGAMLQEAQGGIAALGALDGASLVVQGADPEKFQAARQLLAPALDRVPKLLQEGPEAGISDAAALEKALCTAAHLSIGRYRQAVEGVMPTVKSMKEIGAEMAAGMMAGTEEDFRRLQADLAALKGFEEFLAGADHAASLSSYRSTLGAFAAIVAAAALLALALTFSIVRSIVRPLRAVVEAIDELSEGRFDRRLEIREGSEIGHLATAFNRMADGLAGKAELTRRMAGGDLTVHVAIASEKDEFGRALQEMVDGFGRIMGNLSEVSDRIATGAGEVASASQSLSQGATEQASSLEQISASMNEMASQTRVNAENALTASTLAREARTAAERGNEQMRQMTVAIDGINAAGRDISRIIKVIDEIAFQTNLLALNAAVEAARAGAHGKGFAVVAEEVRNLAARSAKAAHETAELIDKSVQRAENGVHIADQTAAVLVDIVTGAGKVADLVAEIAAASDEQAQGISQVNLGLGQIDQVTQQNTASAEETAAASQELSGEADRLRQILGGFQIRNGNTAPALAWSQDS